jgi:3-oxoacyl-[acyl-carrier-protein] synthase-3
VKTLDAVVDETLAANNLDKSAIDWLVPHQANLRIITATAKRLDMPMERVIVTVDRHGNTSAASVPLALDDAVRSGKIKRGQLLLLEAFGGGFTWGSALIRYERPASGFEASIERMEIRHTPQYRRIPAGPPQYDPRNPNEGV